MFDLRRHQFGFGVDLTHTPVTQQQLIQRLSKPHAHQQGALLAFPKGFIIMKRSSQAGTAHSSRVASPTRIYVYPLSGAYSRIISFHKAHSHSCCEFVSRCQFSRNSGGSSDSLTCYADPLYSGVSRPFLQPERRRHLGCIYK